MPFVWTHILFSEEVIDAANKPYSKYDDCMKLGAQGLYFFTHHRLWLNSRDTLSTFGEDLYDNHYGEFIADLIISAKGNSSQIQSYVLGQVTHYVLNKNTHPYINYCTNKYNCSREQMEVILDALLMDQYYNIKTWKNKIHKEIDISTKFHQDIIDLLNHIFKKHYPELNSAPNNYIQKAFREWKRALRILSDPYGWKSFLLKPFRSLVVYGPVRTTYDFLNLNHSTWQHPETKESSSKSFVDLFNQSRVEGIEVITAVLNFWKGKNHFSKHALLEFLNHDKEASAAE